MVSGLFSCRSSKQSVSEYSDTTSVVVAETSEKLSHDDFVSLINASRELDLSGITVEFFPPDSIHPNPRAAPKSIRIESAKSKETKDVAEVAASTVDEQKTVNLSAQSSETRQQKNVSETEAYNPVSRIVRLAAFIGIISLIILLIFLKKRHHDSLQR